MEVSSVNFDESQQLGSWYPSLLGLAEHFRTSDPPNVKFCVHCLQAIFNFNPSPIIQARTHLQIGTVLTNHGKNVSLALSHLKRAWNIAQTCHSADDIKFEAVCVSSKLYGSQNQLLEARQFLRKALEQSLHSPYWHCRLLFQLAQCEMEVGDHGSAITTLSAGFEYATHRQSDYARLLFLLSKAMVLLIERKLADVQQSMSQISVILDQWTLCQNHLKDTIKVFFLVLNVWQYLLTGQVKAVKPALKQLQQTIQTITSAHNEGESAQGSTNPIEMFQWLPKDHMCVLVYLVTVIHSMQAGYMDKAQKYTDKALIQIGKLKMTDDHPLLSSFQVMLLEHITMCRLITGHKSVAIQQILKICHICHADLKIQSRHLFQIHMLLGLYAMSVNSMESAEAQFKYVLESPDMELKAFSSLNLSLVYLRMNRTNELNSLLESIDSGKVNTVSHGLRASTYYVRGLQAFFQARHHDAKRYLRESLKMANAEDLNRLTSCSLVLLGHVFLSLGNSQEALNMVSPAMQLAAKIPDIHVQLWASAVLKDLYRILGNPQSEAESYRMHDSFSQKLLQDHLQSTQLVEHQLIQWTDGPFPFFSQPTNSTSISNDCLVDPWNPVQMN